MIINLTERLNILDAPVREVYPYAIDSNYYIRRICKERNISAVDFLGESRKSYLVKARVDLAKILDQKGYMRKDIAEALNKDGSTITHYLKYYDRLKKRKSR